MKGFIIYPGSRVIEGVPCVLLYGRLENGQSFLTINKFKPYFFIESKNLKKAKKLGDFEVEETDLTNFKKEKVTKLILNHPKDISELKSILESEKIITYEADIRYPIKFLIDNKIQGSLEIDGDYETSDTIDRIYKNPDISKTEYVPKNLKILSFDIETDKKAKTLYCISSYSKDHKKSFIISKNKVEGAEIFKDEEDLLEAFQQDIIDFDPDIITGWNVVDFDFKFLRDKFKKYNIPFILGRDNSISKLRLESSFFRTSKAEIAGRVVLDGLDLTRSSFVKLENYKLDTAAKTLLGKGKLIDSTGKQKYQEIDRLFKEDKKNLIKYNLLDSELAYRVITEADLVDLAIQRSILTGMSLERVNASIASLDFLYLQRARDKKLVCPTSANGERGERIKGGYVMESLPGIYDNIIVLDFKSLYPSIVKTFNIDPSSYHEKEQKGDIESPNKAHFANEDGILPNIIQELWIEREKSRKSKNELSRYAIKILMNSFFGVLANPSCRFYNINLANAITNFGQDLIKKTAEQIEERGYKVIYSDTDSVFIDTKLDSYKQSEKIGKELERSVNEFHDKRIKRKYKRESSLELEYEKCYSRFLMPKLRGKETGAKKRYAGLIIKDGKEEVQFVGLETVRSDWTNAAKNFQKKLYDKIFHKEDPTPFIKKYVEEILSGNQDKNLVYRKSIRKDLKEYTKITPQHIRAARKLKKLESNIIEYYITTDGPEPIQILKHDIDYDHYIKKQIKPIADSILQFFDIDFEEIISGNKQTTLFGFS
ncbi:DNA polymerase II [archaeon]|jgi:DNA polymerase II|nr:DNA polymerase II [archaeon]MBT6824068.1 DNA polymerase II [archaeon]MBT7107087.1 DNA polymerase II [archaeon]MBT7297699.1 DNA polymerase II [archaeon]